MAAASGAGRNLEPGRTILVGVDSSEGARSALAFAAGLAESLDLELRVVAAWSYPATAALPGGPSLLAPEEMDVTTRNQAREALAEVTGRQPDQVAEHEIAVARGPADRAILSAASDAALVVVGKRGLGTLEGRVLGSISRRVTELSPVPVVVAPSGPAPTDGPIVVGVDGSESAATARDWAADIARRLGGEVVVVHGIAGLPAELPPSAIDRFIDRAQAMVEGHVAAVAATGVTPRKVVEVADARLLLASVGAERGARMIVVGSQGDGPASGLLIGSVVNHVVQHADRPVVVVR